MAKARHESQLDIGSFAHGEISLRCIFAFVCTSQHLTSHPQMLLHVVCHSYSCIAMCTAWLLTGHRAVALPHFGSWYPGCSCATVSALHYTPMTYFAHPWQNLLSVSARQRCKGFIMGCSCAVSKELKPGPATNQLSIG